MTTNEQAEKSKSRGHQERQQAGAAIGIQVRAALGEPADLHRVDVRLLWDGHYRVNVLVGPDATCVRVRHSYFLVTDSSGKIVAATPSIRRLYSPGAFANPIVAGNARRTPSDVADTGGLADGA